MDGGVYLGVGSEVGGTASESMNMYREGGEAIYYLNSWALLF